MGNQRKVWYQCMISLTVGRDARVSHKQWLEIWLRIDHNVPYPFTLCLKISIPFILPSDYFSNYGIYVYYYWYFYIFYYNGIYLDKLIPIWCSMTKWIVAHMHCVLRCVWLISQKINPLWFGILLYS